MLVAALTLLPATQGAAGSDRLEGSDPKIVGGAETTIAEWPWQVAVTLSPNAFGGDGFDRQICGGSLVAPRIVVTAAHCVYDFDSDEFDSPALFASITGRTTLSNSSEGREIPWSDYYYFVDGSGDPLYNPNTDEWDVVFALLNQDTSDVPNSDPILIAGQDEAAAWAPPVPPDTNPENLWATGWGTTAPGGASSDTLREVNLDRISDADCGDVDSYGNDFESETMVCAGEELGGQDTCQGDSGGPLVTPVGTNPAVFRRVGDTSWGVSCAVPEKFGVYGRVAQEPMCGALQSAIQSVAGVDVVGPGGCLGDSPAGGSPGFTDAPGQGPAPPPPPPPPPPPLEPDPLPKPEPAPVLCANRVATIVGTPGSEPLRGTPGRDVIAGLGGRDAIRGFGGNDILCGGLGADVLRGGAGRDWLIGGPGGDRLLGGGGRDRCAGGPGRDSARTC